ncbi:MerR family transcriptional regulator [Sphingomonas sp. Leaf357]|uniref:MerR family transcriptional regulator n=1 Tax=Sphingomonas sp. Leaf357 TaxID=1736350 RepID=UPI0006F67C07|nr:MerR family transcriptional regulator [Sphingomonas sp. Leaf357]KQS03275.1 MerR family transcriptional regulator [Sphingomonas sp. Leaf357]
MTESGAPDKAAGAFRTIGELSRETGLPQHILRYWETRFPQLRPLQRAGNRRYYRPADIALVLRIQSLLEQEGYTIRGVQKLLMTERKRGGGKVDLAAVQEIRDSLADGLEQDKG